VSRIPIFYVKAHWRNYAGRCSETNEGRCPSAPAPPFCEQVAGRLVLGTTDRRSRQAREFWCAQIPLLLEISGRALAAIGRFEGPVSETSERSYASERVNSAVLAIATVGWLLFNIL